MFFYNKRIIFVANPSWMFLINSLILFQLDELILGKLQQSVPTRITEVELMKRLMLERAVMQLCLNYTQGRWRGSSHCHSDLLCPLYTTGRRAYKVVAWGQKWLANGSVITRHEWPDLLEGRIHFVDLNLETILILLRGRIYTTSI